MESNDIRLLFNSVATGYQPNASLTPAERGVDNTALQTNVASLPPLLAQGNRLLGRASVAMQELSGQLAAEHKAVSADERKALQASAHDTGVLLRRLGNAITMLGQRVTSLQLVRGGNRLV
jgi:hypothetical protein